MKTKTEHKPITLADLDMSPAQMQIFADGARVITANPEETPERSEPLTADPATGKLS